MLIRYLIWSIRHLIFISTRYNVPNKDIKFIHINISYVIYEILFIAIYVYKISNIIY